MIFAQGARVNLNEKIATYWAPGAVLVNRRIRHRFCDSLIGEDSQIHAAWVNHTLVISSYCPPRQDNFLPLLHDFWVRNSVFKIKSWRSGGDFDQNLWGFENFESNDDIPSFLHSLGAGPITDSQPMRWDGKRCVDWFACSPQSSLR